MIENDPKRSTAADSTGSSDIGQGPKLKAVRQYDPDGGGDLTTELVFAIADARGVDPDEVRSPPLYDSVDTVALENLFFGEFGTANDSMRTLRLEFSYAEFVVRVESDGTIKVY